MNLFHFQRVHEAFFLASLCDCKGLCHIPGFVFSLSIMIMRMQIILHLTGGLTILGELYCLSTIIVYFCNTGKIKISANL